MAFSNADRVMISRGRIFFSSRLRMAAPTEAHSRSFSGYSAGNDEDPGRVMPRASAALAIVFAVYIYPDVSRCRPQSIVYLRLRRHQDRDMHAGWCCTALALRFLSYHPVDTFHRIGMQIRCPVEVHQHKSPDEWYRHRPSIPGDLIYPLETNCEYERPTYI